MKKICVLLNGGIASDSRVIREIKTMSNVAFVDLFYIDERDIDIKIFNENVRLFPCRERKGLITKIIKHTCFYNAYMFFVPIVLKHGVVYDYVWANDLPDLKPALMLKKSIGSKVIYDSHEIFVGTLNQFFPKKARWYKSILHRIALLVMTLLGNREEKKMVKSVDEFVTTNLSFKEYFQRKFGRNDIHIVMNCPNLQTESTSYDFRKKYNLPQTSFILLFQGRLNAGRALLEMIESIKYVKENVHLFIIGDGPLKKEMQMRTKDLMLLNKIHFIEEVPSSELLIYTRGADVGINLQENINISKYLASANKLFEYIQSGIPIIASDVPENRRIIERYEIGILVKNEPREVADAINKILEMDMDMYNLNCKRAALDYNWEKQELELLKIIGEDN